MSSSTGLYQSSIESLENEELRKKEDMKMKCGKAHFENFADVEYRPVSAFNDLIDPV